MKKEKKLKPVAPTVIKAEGSTWRRVIKPVLWRPEEEGEILVGLYGGRQTFIGAYGSYEALLVKTPEGVRKISGVTILALLDGAGTLSPTTRLRIVFLGLRPCVTTDHEYKDYDLFVEQVKA